MSEPLAAGEDRSGGLGVSGIRGSNSVVESQPSKLLVAGSTPVSRSIFEGRKPTELGDACVVIDMLLTSDEFRCRIRGRCSSVGRARPW